MKKIFLLIFLFLPLIPAQAAGGLVPCGGQNQPTCQLCHVFVLTNNIINLVLYTLTPLVAVLMFVVGGMYFLVAAGNPGLFNKAKSILVAAIIGLLIIFISWVFLNTFLDFIGVAQWTNLKAGGWSIINCPVQVQ